MDTIRKNVFTILLSILSMCCAGQLPPPGGPVDKIPPEVIETVPAAGTLRFTGNTISIQFSKYISPLKVQEAIFLSPNVGTLSYDWGWKDVKIHFTDTLRPATTYILTLGTDAEDTHGNKLARAFALPFSTGDKIDSASITGRIFDQNPWGVMIFAYKLDGRLADTLDPDHTKPDFLTQTGKEGLFSLTNLAAGHYRIMAVRDEYKNLVYDIQIDQFGMSPRDFTLPADTSSITGVQFRLTSSDTSLPFLSSAKALNRTVVLLRFNKPMDATSIDEKNVSIVDTVSHQPLMIQDISFSENPLEAHLSTPAQDSTVGYKATVVGARDLHGNKISSSGGVAVFTGGSKRDTLFPIVKFMSGGDSLKNIDPLDTLWLTFGKPVKRTGIGRAIHLFDSTKHEIDLHLRWLNSVRAIIFPASLRYNAWYMLKISLDSVRDFDGTGYHDSTLVRRFRTISDETMASVQGTILDDFPDEPGNILLVLEEINKSASPRVLTLPAAGPFTFDHVREGKYVLSAYHNRSMTGSYGYGNVFPFQPSERFTVYPDTLKVRARWPLEGVELRLKKF